MQRRPDVYLELALIALRKVPRFLGGRTLEKYLADDYCQAAVERQLEIAGDALGQLRKAAPNLFERIPEGDLIVAFRNVLVHGYAVLDQGKVFEAANVEDPLIHSHALALRLQSPDARRSPQAICRYGQGL